MSSGWGLRGGVGRCYPFWAEYKECLKNERTSVGLECFKDREDYFECLHNRKEHALVRIVNEEEKRQAELAKKGGGGGEGGGH
mmetsp:Transcript_43577/g.132636  ORF Transcript_43577/g.132636 Transcript_43577/m.132636 type:complete len:83 (+) Transcript_43577:139-387(+)|eukprot:CAMPEP_0113531524 /NCGR_PEP_ID=MMETSP0015_2-20120614/3541_1 /TAXON_ID=2838 /ORGANISM="Odontella" /LENGTH=82 /DNA_ID=CAMNT_0000430363 /DNA_START=131 /DNA_END=379 /DNA_ORIENTATION=+ /assembly_acc=CAM_ASM_000160